VADENYKRKLCAILTADRAGMLGAQGRENYHDLHSRPKPGWQESQELRGPFVEEKQWPSTYRNHILPLPKGSMLSNRLQSKDLCQFRL